MINMITLIIRITMIISIIIIMIICSRHTMNICSRHIIIIWIIIDDNHHDNGSNFHHDYYDHSDDCDHIGQIYRIKMIIMIVKIFMIITERFPWHVMTFIMTLCPRNIMTILDRSSGHYIFTFHFSIISF